jgi:hypothetical protein
MQGEILGLHIVLTLEESTMCHARILSRVDDCAEVKMSQLEEREARELAEKQLAALLPGFEPSDLPITDLVLATQLNLRTPLWIVLACRVIKGLVELYGFTQFAPDDPQLAPLSCSIAGRAPPLFFYDCYCWPLAFMSCARVVVVIIPYDD